MDFSNATRLDQARIRLIRLVKVAYYDEIKTASAQAIKYRCISTIYEISIMINYVIPILWDLIDIYPLIYRDWIVIELNEKYLIISVTDLRDIWN